MTDFEHSKHHPEQNTELFLYTDRVVTELEALGPGLDMDLSDVNPFDSTYIYTAERENDISKLRIIKADLSDFHGSPVTTNQYSIKVVAKEVDDEGLRLVEEFTIAQDKVADELRLGGMAVELIDPMQEFAVTIEGDIQPQADRISHRVTLGEFDQAGDYIIDDIPLGEASVVEVSPGTFEIDLSQRRQRVYRELPILEAPIAILGRIEAVLSAF